MVEFFHHLTVFSNSFQLLGIVCQKRSQYDTISNIFDPKEVSPVSAGKLLAWILRIMPIPTRDLGTSAVLLAEDIKMIQDESGTFNTKSIMDPFAKILLFHGPNSHS